MIGLFDSGVGGLSIFREVRRLLPGEDIVYFGDTANVPYGPRSSEEIIKLTLAAVEVLLPYYPDLIVVACNTATSVAIQTLRAQYSEMPIIGVVPVVKTLAEKTRNKKVVVCATTATLNSELYKKLKQDFTAGINVLELARPEWVMMVERGDLTSPELQTSITTTAQEIIDFGADAVALGSTHFPWLRPLLEPALPGVTLLDSGPAVARHLARVLAANQINLSITSKGQERFIVSGDQESFSFIASRLLARKIFVGA